VTDGYALYRGKCREMSEALAAEDPGLRLVRGHYHCPFWGEQAHWWCVRKDGTVVDPTKDQFPSRGIGAYVEYDGTVTCSNCGKEGREEDFDCSHGHYCFCSVECHCRFVGV